MLWKPYSVPTGTGDGLPPGDHLPLVLVGMEPFIEVENEPVGSEPLTVEFVRSWDVCARAENQGRVGFAARYPPA